MKKKIVSGLLAVVMLLGMMPMSALAATTVGGLTIEGGMLDTDYSYDNGILTVLTDKILTVSSNDSVTERIVIGNDVNANIILNGVTLTPEGSPFTVPNAASANIILAAGTVNTLTGGVKNSIGYAGLNVQSGAVVTIACGNHPNGDCNGDSGCGKLVATGGFSGWNGTGAAGIGGNENFNSGSAGTVIINGGNISAIGGGSRSAGIGGGGGYGRSGNSPHGGHCGTVTINGGYVTAVGGGANNGIGGGLMSCRGWADGFSGTLTVAGGVLADTSFNTIQRSGTFKMTGGTLKNCDIPGNTEQISDNWAEIIDGTVVNSTVSNIKIWNDSQLSVADSVLSFSMIPELTTGGNNNTYATKVEVNGAHFTGTTNFKSDVNVTGKVSFEGTKVFSGDLTVAYTNGMTWYGEDENAANAAGAKPTSNIGEGCNHNYLRISPVYTVTYIADGEVVSTVEVEHGKDATAPAIPAKDGYTQTAPAWDKDGRNITADTEINAVYTINKYTVTYKADGEVVSAVEVEHGKDATAPAIPAKDGYTQIAPAWDKDGKNITADTEINAVYTINEYTITFMDENGVYKTLTVKHGEAVTMPDVPAKDGYTVTWNTTIEKATGDTTIKAVYTGIPKTDTPSSPQTGDNSNMMLWIVLLFVSAGTLAILTVVDKKRITANK